MRSAEARWLLGLVAATGVAGCWYQPETGDPGGVAGDPPQCSSNEDCASFDGDDDRCTAAVCDGGKCRQDLLYTMPDCQCHTAADCDYFAKPCNVTSCEEHQCQTEIAPAGPAAKQADGDCAASVCDGVGEEAVDQYDELDLPDDGNDCTVDTCDPTSGAVYQGQPDGTACNDEAGFCFVNVCMACQPQDAGSCGGDGVDEPQNDSGTSATPYARHARVCGFSDESDVDWYTFYASDDFLSYDVLDFNFWSSAPELEVCAYVTCLNGSPGGGCATKLPGPNGSQGCCWSGAPATLKPTWDLDCTGFDDRGTVYISVRTPGASACETYAMTASY